MPGPCRTPNCPRNRAHRKTRCHPCRMRLRRHGNVHAILRTDLAPENVEAAVIRRAFPEGLTEAERRAAGQRLLQLGHTVDDIAARSGASTRTVWRWKAALTA